MDSISVCPSPDDRSHYQTKDGEFYYGETEQDQGIEGGDR